MDGMFDHDILRELVKLNAAIEALPKAIAVAVRDELIDSSTEEPAPAPTVCDHPADKRVDLDDGEWACGIRGCKHRHTPEPVTA